MSKNINKPLKNIKDNRKNSFWKPEASLISPLSAQIKEELELLPEALNKVWPLTRSHRKTLPADIKELSEILTSQRSELRKPYWMKPAYTSAYLYYFLPWNIIRLVSLLAELPLRKPDPLDNKPQLLIDLGSGPLTFPIALWLAKPQWRNLRLQIISIDTARQPLIIGKKLFSTLASRSSQPAWEIEIFPGNTLSFTPGAIKSDNLWLISMANTLNELLRRDKMNKKEEEIEESEASREKKNDDIFALILQSWLPLFQNEPQMLFVEPGARLGGTAIMKMRANALEAGLTSLTPCAHNKICPLLKTSGNYSSSWCHFSFSTANAPAWLHRLSNEAELSKESLTLSPLFLSGKEQKRQKKISARIISQGIKVPGLIGEARYACSELGLLLLENAANLKSGDIVEIKKPQKIIRDKKSGAIVIAPFE